MTPRQRNAAIASLRAELAALHPSDPRRGDMQRRLAALVHQRMREARDRRTHRRTAA
jgi:hypothetical protein